MRDAIQGCQLPSSVNGLFTASYRGSLVTGYRERTSSRCAGQPRYTAPASTYLLCSSSIEASTTEQSSRATGIQFHQVSSTVMTPTGPFAIIAPSSRFLVPSAEGYQHRADEGAYGPSILGSRSAAHIRAGWPKRCLAPRYTSSLTPPKQIMGIPTGPSHREGSLYLSENSLRGRMSKVRE